VVGYGRCASSAAATDCAAAQDGVWFASLVDGRWQVEPVVNDEGARDGVEIHLAIDPATGWPVIAYRDLLAARVRIARATPQP